MRFTLAAAAFVAVVATPAAAAVNLVTNGDFEITNFAPNAEFDSVAFPNKIITGWSNVDKNGYNLYFNPATATSVDAISRFPGEQQRLASSFDAIGASPVGGNFVALDGDNQVDSAIEQTVTGLSAGSRYVVKFFWAVTQLSNRTGETTEQLRVTFGNDTQSTAVLTNASQQTQGWFNESFTFTAANTSQVLTFLSVGTPNGLPPFALLDGVSVTAVPEASTWALMIAGFGLVGFAARRRRTTVVAA